MQDTYFWYMETFEEIKPIIQNLVSVDDYANFVAKKSRRTIYNWISEGKLKPITFMGKLWLDKTVLKKD